MDFEEEQVEDPLDQEEITEEPEAETPESDEDEGAEPFFDGEVPEELLPVKKQMERALHAKFREAAEQRKSTEARLAEIEQKAKAFDRAVLDPSYRAQLFAAAGNGAQPEAAKPREYRSFYGADLDKWEPDSLKDLKEASMAAFQEQVLPQMEQVIATFTKRIDALEGERVMSEWTELSSEMDGASENLDAVSDFLRENPNFLANKPRKERLRKALLVVMDAPPAKAPAAQPKRGTQRKANNGNLLGNGASTAGARPKTHGKSLSDLLKEHSKRLGIQME